MSETPQEITAITPETESTVPTLNPTTNPATNPSLEPIPLRMTFQKDPNGHKAAIYKIIRRAGNGLTIGEIKNEVERKIRDGSIKIEPLTVYQISKYLDGIKQEMALLGICATTPTKRKRSNEERPVSVYQIHRIGETPHIKYATIGQIEGEIDTEIDPEKYMRSIRSILPTGTYAAAMIIAEKSGRQLSDLIGLIDTKNLSPKLSALNTIGTSCNVPQHFRFEIRKEDNGYGKITHRYYLIIYKPHEKSTAQKPHEDQVIQELLNADTKTVFGIKTVVQKLIRDALEGNDGNKIASRIRDIDHTLEIITANKPETERITGLIRAQLASVLAKYETSGSKYFSEALRRELRSMH